jgi:2-hydroxy-3-keto-5-methylthiopentenyl-1-phosphate phosphatase
MPGEYKVFFDFDNTITGFDVLRDFLRRFSVNENWIALEHSWETGKIGSAECLKGQMEAVRIRKRALLKYLSGIKIDPHFKRILTLLKDKGLNAFILSDNFSFFIKSILEQNRIDNHREIVVCANEVVFENQKLIPYFPHHRKFRFCPGCGNCKKTHLLCATGKRSERIYIGDGQSDICAAEEAEIVLAKGRLLEHFRRRQKKCIPFRNLGDVYSILKGNTGERALKKP